MRRFKYTRYSTFRFPAFLGGGFCYSVISSRRYTPPALLASLKYRLSMRIPLACCLLSCVLDDDLVLFFLLFLSFFEFYLDMVCFILSFFLRVPCCLLGFGSAATRLVYDMYLDTFVR